MDNCFAFVCYSQMNTSGSQVHFLSFSRNISVQLIWVYSGYQEQLGASGMQIQYNYVIVYIKTMLGNVFPILMHIIFA